MNQGTGSPHSTTRLIPSLLNLSNRFPVLRRLCGVPGLLLLVSILAYGLWLPWYGLFGDDWPYLWVYHTLGAGGYARFLAWDRPFSTWIYYLITPLFGETVWLYHTFLLVLRWLGGVALWWVLRQIWPKQTAPAAWVALLFITYPGFRQQPVPLEFVLHFSTFALFNLSLGLMVKALRQPQQARKLHLLGVAADLGIFGLEYFVGLELLRPVVLWLTLREQGQRQGLVKRVLRHWLPYLAVLVIFLIWRVFIFKFPTYQPGLMTGLAAAPAQTLMQLARQVLQSLAAVTVGAWRLAVTLPATAADRLIYGLVAAAGALLVVLYLKKTIPSQPEAEGWAWQPLGLGVLALLLAGVPFWVTQLPVEVSFPWDRSTLPFMLGMALLISGLVALIIQPRWQNLAVALLVAACIGGHFANAAQYRDEWRNFRTFFWQMAWRAPGLQAGTVLVSDQIPLYRVSDNNLTATLNWIYDPANRTPRMSFKLFDLESRDVNDLFTAKKGQPVKHTYRGLSFASTTDALLLFYQPRAGCLKLLDASAKNWPGLPDSLQALLPLSNLSQVQSEAPALSLPRGLFGAEPPHTWCFYYEQADLARQRGDWAEVVRLGEEAQSRGLSPQDGMEWLPFLEGYARSGRWETARTVTQTAVQTPANLPAVCALLSRLQKPADASGQAGALRVKAGCGTP